MAQLIHEHVFHDLVVLERASLDRVWGLVKAIAVQPHGVQCIFLWEVSTGQHSSLVLPVCENEGGVLKVRNPLERHPKVYGVPLISSCDESICRVNRILWVWISIFVSSIVDDRAWLPTKNSPSQPKNDGCSLSRSKFSDARVRNCKRVSRPGRLGWLLLEVVRGHSCQGSLTQGLLGSLNGFLGGTWPGTKTC